MMGYELRIGSYGYTYYELSAYRDRGRECAAVASVARGSRIGERAGIRERRRRERAPALVLARGPRSSVLAYDRAGDARRRCGRGREREFCAARDGRRRRGEADRKARRGCGRDDGGRPDSHAPARAVQVTYVRVHALGGPGAERSGQAPAVADLVAAREDRPVRGHEDVPDGPCSRGRQFSIEPVIDRDRRRGLGRAHGRSGRGPAPCGPEEDVLRLAREVPLVRDDVVVRVVNFRSNEVLRKERIIQIHDLFVPCRSEDRDGGRFVLDRTEDPPARNGVDLGVGPHLHHLRARTHEHDAAEWDGRELLLTDELHAGKVVVPGVVDGVTEKRVALAVRRDHVHSVHALRIG